MRPARRLIFALIGLVVLDQFVPEVLRRAEHHRYEETRAFRFESSDLFGLGPLVSYLGEHPPGDRPRIVFLGNSTLFGLDLAAAEAVPGQFQRLHPDTQVFNAAINGFDLGSNYRIARAMIGSVDRFYVMRGTAVVNPLLASLIPLDDYEAAALHLERQNVLEGQLQSIAGLWRLYAASYRLQAALFGTSTQQFLHRLTRPAAMTVHGSADGAVEVIRSRSTIPPTVQRQAELRKQDGLLWSLAELVSEHRRRVIILQIGAPTPGAIGEPEIAEFNAAFAPYAEIVTLVIAPALKFDPQHLTAVGARRVAEALP